MENETLIYDNKKTVLIVDDEQHILDILTFNLKKEGYSILEANDGVKAVEIALEKKPDIVLLDIMLPGMDGLSVCKRIKHSLNIPVLMLTAKDQEIDKILGLELGADDYITKPFSVRELMARIKANLRKAEVDIYRNVKQESEPKEKETRNEIIVGELRLDLDRFEVIVRNEVIDLTL